MMFFDVAARFGGIEFAGAMGIVQATTLSAKVESVQGESPKILITGMRGQGA
jgi:hypothetical protein